MGWEASLQASLPAYGFAGLLWVAAASPACRSLRVRVQAGWDGCGCEGARTGWPAAPDLELSGAIGRLPHNRLGLLRPGTSATSCPLRVVNSAQFTAAAACPSRLAPNGSSSRRLTATRSTLRFGCPRSRLAQRRPTSGFTVEVSHPHSVTYWFFRHLLGSVLTRRLFTLLLPP